MKAESRVTTYEEGEADVDADDGQEELQYRAQSLEGQYLLSELLASIWIVYRVQAYPIYLHLLQEFVYSLSHVFCLMEDRRFAWLVFADIVKYAFRVPVASEGEENKIKYSYI